MPDLSLPPPLAARYRALEVLGVGSFGRVLRAHDSELERGVAIKVLHRDLGGSAAARFTAEAESLARLEHPGVVRVFDHGQDAGSAWIVMEMLEGTSLAEEPPADPVAAMRAAAEGLQAIHDAGLLHRDVKPANILRTRDGRVVLLDLGLVLDPSRERLTRTGDVVGTLDYLAPELLAGPEGTPASDWYAWGATLYRLLEDRPPYHPAMVMAAAEGVELPALRFEHTAPESPAARTAAACLSRDPAARPRDLEQIRWHLAASVAPSQQKHRPPQALAGSARRTWLGPLLGLTGMLGLGVAIGVFLATGPGDPRTPASPSPPSPGLDRDRAAQALENLEKACARLGAGHHGPDGVYRVSTGGLAGEPEHIPAVQREYVDGRIVGRYRRALETQERWLMVAAPEDVERLLRGWLGSFWLHMITDESMVVAALISRRPGLMAEEADPEIVRARLEELMTLRQANRRLADRFDGLSNLILRVIFGDYRVSARDPGEIRARLARAESLTDPLARLHGANAVASFLNYDLLGTGATLCEERARALRLIRQSLTLAPPESPPALVARARASLLVGLVVEALSCRQEVTADQLEQLGAQVTAQRALLAEAPDEVCGPTRAYLEGLLVFLEAGGSFLVGEQPALRARIRGIRGLVAEARAHQGAPPLPRRLLEGSLMDTIPDFR